MESCIMHKHVPTSVDQCMWVCQREAREYTFIPKTLHICGHQEENEMSHLAEHLLRDWQEGREGYVGKYGQI